VEEGDVNAPCFFGKKAREEAMKFDPDAPLLFEEETWLLAVELEGTKGGGRAA